MKPYSQNNLEKKVQVITIPDLRLYYRDVVVLEKLDVHMHKNSVRPATHSNSKWNKDPNTEQLEENR